MEDGFLGSVGEAHVAKFEPPLGDLEFARIRPVGLEVALVEEGVQQADAEQ